MDNIDINLTEASQKSLQDKLVKMDERNDTRKRMETKRRKDKYEMGSHAEQTNAFFKNFREQETIIECQLQIANEAGVNGENRAQLTIKLDDIFKIIDDLKRYLTESAMILTSFDNEQAKKDFQTLQNKFSTLRDSLLPKKKFGFTAKTKNEKENSVSGVENNMIILDDSAQSDSSTLINNGESDKSEIVSKVTSLVDQSDCGFRDEHGKKLMMEGEAVNGKDLSVLRVSDCIIHILGSPGSIYIHDVSDSTIVCGPTTRSVFISQCNNCTFYFACQQARIHDSHNSRFYIHVTCSAIIETCDKVYFAPYLLEYCSLDQDFQRSGLNRDVNNWSKVEDFCHLSMTTASPNWSVIDESDRQILII